jgi:putative phosphotransacetylase
MEVTVGISNRHIHLTEEDFKILFGEDATLEVEKPINQPGQFASKSFVTLKTEKSEIEHVRVLGPCRSYTQIEISKTDARKLGITPPVRESGDIKDSSPITLIGPNGTLEKKEGCIIADRHIHILPAQVKQYDLEGIDEVAVLTKGEKGGILYHVKLRVSENSYFEMHIDTDDANAHLLQNGSLVQIIKMR